MEGFADLLTDAFSVILDESVITETSVLSFPDGDLDFENLGFDEQSEEEKTDDKKTTTDGAFFQEATAETKALLGSAAQDMLYVAENAEDQSSDESGDGDFKGASLMSKTHEDNYTSSEGESEKGDSVPDENEEEDVGSEEEARDLLVSVRCHEEFPDSIKEDEIIAEGLPMAPEGADNPQDRNKVRGEAESDEDVAYFGGVPEHSNEMMVKGDVNEDERQEIEEGFSVSECEGLTITPGENVCKQETESPYRGAAANTILEFPSLSLPNLQDLIAEVDGEENVEKMTDFSGEDHQEAGECFADYPSDLSSFEYTEDGGNNQETKSNASTCMRQPTCPENVTWMGAGETDEEREDDFLYSKDLEMNGDEVMRLDVAGREQAEAVRESDDGDETGESESYSSSDEGEPLRTSREELAESVRVHYFENDKQMEDGQIYGGSGGALSAWSVSDDRHLPDSGANQADFSSWDFDVLKTDTFLSDYLLSTEDTDKAETCPSYVQRCPDDDANSYSEVHREDRRMISLSNQGSLDDSFFFNTELEASGVSEPGQQEHDEYEDERNWEKEQERIKAFYKFYNDSDEENPGKGRQIKVQFSSDQLSQVIHYETESSDRDSLTSSDGEEDTEEDMSSTDTPDEMKESGDILQKKDAADPPDVQVPESPSDHSVTQTFKGTNKTLSTLKLILKMVVLLGMGLLMFCLTADQMDWLSQLFFFYGYGFLSYF
ncbi:uncharacterized protein ACNS7B_008918 isoform 2-T2 [Menidia menidia]